MVGETNFDDIRQLERDNYNKTFSKIKRRGAALVCLAAGSYTTYKFGEGFFEFMKFFALPEGVCPENTTWNPSDYVCEYDEGYGPTTAGVIKTATAGIVAVGSFFYFDDELGKHPDY